MQKKYQEMENIESLTFSIVVTFQIKIHYWKPNIEKSSISMF